jgi:hypothetical protein
MSIERAPPMILATMAALLDQGRAMDALSRLVTVLALGALLAIPLLELSFPEAQWTLAGVVAVGLLQLSFAMRVSFDAALFRELARVPAGDKLDLKGLDDALATLRLVRSGKAGRPLQPRLDGARKLFRLQMLTLALQLSLMLAAVIIVALA